MKLFRAPKRSFPRRTKTTGPPDTTEAEAIDTTTSKYTRRGVSSFKSRKETSQNSTKKEIRPEDSSDRRRPYLNGDARRSERPTRNFVRRRLGGANATSSSSGPSTVSPPNHRPFRVGSRRRLSTTTTAATITTSSSTPLPAAAQFSEESLQDIDDTDVIEDPTLQDHAAPKTPKIQRRPLTSLKDDDQNPSATNEDERKKQNKTPTSGEEEKKRHSKKYSSSFKQNQLDEVLRQKAKSQEEVDVTTEGKSTKHKDSEEIDVTTTVGTTSDDYSAETALAIAAHQLLAAPLPSVPNYDVEYKPTKKSIPQTTYEYSYTSPEYTDVDTGKTYSDKYTTPIYKVTQEYIPTSTLEYSVSPSAFNSLKTTTSTYVAPKSSVYPPTAFSSRARPTGFSTPKVLSSSSPTTSSFTSTRASTHSEDRSTFQDFPRGRSTYTSGLSRVSQSVSPTISSYSESRGAHLTSPTVNTEFTRGRSTYTPVSQSLSPTISSFSETARGVDFSSPATINTELSRVQPTSGYSGVSQNFHTSSRLPSSVAPSTAGYLGSSEKLIPVPVEDYSLAPEGYSTGLGQEPAYFTREYLLESPVTKTYDDEYQYLSPITTPQSTRKLPKKTVYRRISTTHRPTAPSATTPKPRRAQPAKPFEKVLKKAEPKRTYKPIENYDYYDDEHEKFADKYDEETKVVLHAKGNIECLDIGNFPHPTSCKKFISCARLENGSLLGWEYICPDGLSFDPVGGICNWSAGLGCEEKPL